MRITADRLRELLHYDPETGVFTHRIGRKGGSTAKGGVAGRLKKDDDGGRRIGLDYGRYCANQLHAAYVAKAKELFGEFARAA